MTGVLPNPLGRNRCAGGFTLIETLVGLTLFALLSVLLFGGFRFGLRAWEVGGERAERAGEIQLVQEMLRRQIAVAQPASILGSNMARPAGVTFAGTETSLTFVAYSPVRAAAAGLYRFELVEAPGDDQRVLTIGWLVFRQDQSNDAVQGEQREVLLEDVAGINLAYFGRIVPTAPAQWLDRWDDSLGLPQLVRLSVRFPAGDERAWPDLFVAPRLHGSGR